MRFYWLTLAAFVGGLAANGAYGMLQLAVAETTGAQPRRGLAAADHGRRQQDQHLRRDRGLVRLPRQLAHGRPEPPRDRARGRDPAPAPDLPPPRARTPAARAARPAPPVPRASSTSRRSRAAACSGSAAASSCSRCPYRRMLLRPQFLVPLGVLLAGLAVFVARRADFFSQVLSSRLSTEGRGADTHFIVYSFIPDVLAQNPLFGLGLNTFSVYYEFQTGQDELRPALVLRRLVRRVRARRDARLRGVPRLPLPARGADAADRSRAGRRRRPARRARPPARLGADRGARLDDGLERLLPDDVLLLLLRARPADDRGAGRVRPRASRRTVKVVVLTTSYPRDADDVAGTFVRDAVEALRAAGRRGRRSSRPRASGTTGSRTATGSSTTCGRRRGRLLALPLFLLSFARAARRAARGRRRRPRALAAERAARARDGQARSCSSSGARTSRSRRRAAARSRGGSSAARGVVVCASTALAERRPRARRARRSRDPERRRDPRDASASRTSRRTSLYVGRLSEEKGVRELAEAAAGLPLVVVGDGPLRSLFPQAVGFVPPRELGPVLRARRRSSSSRRAARDTAWSPARRWRTARPVVATAVGGLVDAVEDGVTGLLVPPRDPAALRAALERLLGDARCRRSPRVARPRAEPARSGRMPRRRDARCADVYAAGVGGVSRCGSEAASGARAARRAR